MKRIVSAVLLAAASLVFAASGFAAPDPKGSASPGPGFTAGKPRVEVTFVLDSTGSIGGLIEGAKQKIWSIANAIISRTPTPEVRIGIVTYRDRGDEYVTRRFDLTEDIDSVYRNLQSITADGGGDDPESVNQALHEAVTDLAWTPGAKVLKIIFLVGDYPPHMDYPDDVKYPVTAQEAVRRGIIIDTVQCGDVAETTPVWKEIARMADGSFVALAQSGNMTAMTTPYDEEIARMSAEISSTVITYGDAKKQEESRSKVAKAAGAPSTVAADRAAYNLASGGKAIQGTGDLVEDLREGRVDLGRLPLKQLPLELQGMSPAQRKEYVASQQARRDALNARLAELSEKRADFALKERRAAAGSDAFDTKVSQIISTQAARVR